MDNKTLGNRQKMVFRGATARQAERGRFVSEGGTRGAAVSPGNEKRRLLQRLLNKSAHNRGSQ